MGMNMKLTIFTPTYNRATTLPRLFKSLVRQTDKRFEWLIIDDGSVDNTQSLIQEFIKKENGFIIRYYKQKHKGKPSAQNKAIDLANGDFFITCDSNKFLADYAVEKILEMAKSIEGITCLAGVGGYRADFSGNIYGGNMLTHNGKFIDCSQLERGKYNLLGDKATAFRTTILKKYKSPIFQGETFITEAVWLIPMACDGYKIRWFPEIICYGEYEKDGLTKQGANSYKGHYENFYGYLEYVKILIEVYGINNVDEMIFEAIDIAKKKKISCEFVLTKIGCRFRKLLILIIQKKIRDCIYSVKQKIKMFIKSI